MSESWIALISVAVGIGALVGAIVGVVFYARTAPATAKRETYGLAESVGVVAGSDLDWQLFYADYDRYRSEHLLPGEGR
jgi:hypothetical protein